MDMDVVTLSRIQFAVTAMYHFLFVPLTLGLSVLLAIMETVWVVTEKSVWRDAVKFWGALFGINFAMGVATGITLEFQFGTNWAYYSHYVGDVFGSMLAIEGMMAFFLEATFIGLFFFGWNRLSRRQHLLCTWLLALGTNFSALWILMANGWMQNPVGSRFNIATMRMEVTDFAEVFLNPVAQTKFVHTISAGYITGAIFVLSVSACFLLKNMHAEIAKRSMLVALCFGLVASVTAVFMGDESGYVAAQKQRMKLAAIEAVWETEEAPASLSVFGFPDMAEKKTHFEIKFPWVLGLIATRSLDEPVAGIDDMIKVAETRIRRGIVAYHALEKLREDRSNPVWKAKFEEYRDDLGYALLLKRYTNSVVNATATEIEMAAADTVPNVPVLYWSFRVMVGLGLYFIMLFGAGYYLYSRKKLFDNRVFLRFALFSLPLPWIAAELGWIVAEMGRQPWTIDGILPTFLSASSISAENVFATLAGFVVFYTALLVADAVLMVKYIRIGPKDG